MIHNLFCDLTLLNRTSDTVMRMNLMMTPGTNRHYVEGAQGTKGQEEHDQIPSEHLSS